ncbi:DUF3800 domain-containing protein [Synechococcus elongatus IITB7]|uniref:DUF3800 domain-containing protein n=1 Tax=Synechococcus elongatus TaxID=32046 RepID=UPI0030CF8A51
MDEAPRSPTCYFVDEAGDGTVFNAKGKVIIGTQGCSRFFMLGLLQVEAPARIGQELENLRQEILADPNLAHIPSLQPDRRKTAIAFHAKDDHPLVRERVFQLIEKHQSQLKFFAVIRCKTALLQYIYERQRQSEDYRYRDNELYDYLVRRLFRDRLHTQEAYRIFFAKRGNSDRTKALKAALQGAIANLESAKGIRSTAAIEVQSVLSRDQPCLQLADYFLWVVQRLFEKQEDQYLQQVLPALSLIVDIDDATRQPFGRYYSRQKPISLVEIQKARPEI